MTLQVKYIELILTLTLLPFLIVSEDVNLPKAECEEKYYVERYQKAVITCKYDRNFHTVRWYFTETDLSFLRIDGTRKSGTGYSSGEYDILDDGSMVINEVNLSHERSYTVSILHSDGSNSRSEIMVIVLVILKDLAITDCKSSPSFCKQYQETDENTVLCIAKDTNPEIELKLMNDNGTTLLSNEVKQFNDTTQLYTTIVTFKHPKRAFTLQFLTCSASGHAVAKVTNASCLVEGNLPVSRITSEVKHVNDNERFQIKCPMNDKPTGRLQTTSINGTKEIVMEAWPNDEHLPCSAKFNCNVLHDGRVEFNGFTYEDERSFECISSDETDASKHTVHLKVLGARPPVDLTVEVGSGSNTAVSLFNEKIETHLEQGNGTFCTLLSVEYEIKGCDYCEQPVNEPGGNLKYFLLYLFYIFNHPTTEEPRFYRFKCNTKDVERDAGYVQDLQAILSAFQSNTQGDPFDPLQSLVTQMQADYKTLHCMMTLFAAIEPKANGVEILRTIVEVNQLSVDEYLEITGEMFSTEQITLQQYTLITSPLLKKGQVQFQRIRDEIIKYTKIEDKYKHKKTTDHLLHYYILGAISNDIVFKNISFHGVGEKEPERQNVYTLLQQLVSKVLATEDDFRKKLIESLQNNKDVTRIFLQVLVFSFNKKTLSTNSFLELLHMSLKEKFITDGIYSVEIQNLIKEKKLKVRDIVNPELKTILKENLMSEHVFEQLLNGYIRTDAWNKENWIRYVASLSLEELIGENMKDKLLNHIIKSYKMNKGEMKAILDSSGLMDLEARKTFMNSIKF
ncbi:hypothetical protein BSL78_08595 [Apostichopus japonicus]|uniref:Immunoglobulin domain-containing protein n=1 Tax=Stichopus japonicus TaxID=307972 RepID=A0A2G8L2N2_STIJA|nr:hypothetical protein BSL78_08595 [Apostichopus japonicus]